MYRPPPRHSPQWDQALILVADPKVNGYHWLLLNISCCLARKGNFSVLSSLPSHKAINYPSIHRLIKIVSHRWTYKNLTPAGLFLLFLSPSSSLLRRLSIRIPPGKVPLWGWCLMFRALLTSVCLLSARFGCLWGISPARQQLQLDLRQGQSKRLIFTSPAWSARGRANVLDERCLVGKSRWTERWPSDLEKASLRTWSIGLSLMGGRR